MPEPYVDNTPKGLVFVDATGRRHAAYPMKEALKRAGISEPTFYRWIRAKKIEDVAVRNRVNWRVFTEEDVARIRRANRRRKRK